MIAKFKVNKYIFVIPPVLNQKKFFNKEIYNNRAELYFLKLNLT